MVLKSVLIWESFGWDIEFGSVFGGVHSWENILCEVTLQKFFLVNFFESVVFSKKKEIKHAYFKKTQTGVVSTSYL
jgi:hypothetical protein